MRKSKTRLENKIEKIIGVLFKETKWKTLFSPTFKLKRVKALYVLHLNMKQREKRNMQTDGK